MDVFSSLFALLQDALDTYIHGSVSNAVGYVDGPLAIMATLSVMGVGSLYILGKTVDPLPEMLKTFAIIAIVFAVAGNVGHYNQYLGNHLHALPNDLMGVFAVGEAPADEQGFGTTMDEFGATAMDGISTIWYAGSGWSRIGFVALSMFLFAIFVLFAVAACVAMGIAMVGSSLVVGIGPIMILGLMLKPTREFFTRWVSYGIQFAVLAAFVGAVLGIMTAVLNEYLELLGNQTDNIDFTELSAPAIIMGICAYLFGQLPSMASSVSGGIGLSVGNSAWRGLSGVAQSTLFHSGGKHLQARGDAAQRRRVESSAQRQERWENWRRQKWEGLTNPNRVDGD
ncbi:MAG: type IV secretion system protein [Thiohalocapsa sp.]